MRKTGRSAAIELTFTGQSEWMLDGHPITEDAVRSRSVVGLAVLLALSGGVAGCVVNPNRGDLTAATTTVRVPYLAADQMVGAVAAAVNGASAVHVKGSATTGGVPVVVDIQLNKDSASGTIATGGRTLPFRSVGGTFYYQLTESVLAAIPGIPPAIRGAVLDKWVSSRSVSDKAMATVAAEFADYRTFMGPLVAALRQATPPVFAGTMPLGRDSVFLYESDDGTAADVAMSNPHYLLRLAGPADGGSVDFTGWNTQLPVAPPAPADLYAGGATFTI